MRYLIILFVVTSGLSEASCIKDLNQHWSNEASNIHSANERAVITDYVDLNNDNLAEKKVTFGNGRSSSAIIYTLDNGCYRRIFSGDGNVSVKKTYMENGGPELKEFNGYKFLRDDSVSGCAGGDRSSRIYAYSRGKYRVVWKTEVYCLRED